MKKHLALLVIWGILIGCGNTGAGARNIVEQAETAYQNGELQEALDGYNQALKIMRETGDRGAEGILLNKIGYVHYLQGEMAQAIDTYEQALDARRDAGDLHGEGNTLHDISIAYAAHGDFR
jgi:tetratricopeptide (TPR) repeat protein